MTISLVSARALRDDNNFHKIASYRKRKTKRRLRGDFFFNNNPLRVKVESLRKNIVVHWIEEIDSHGTQRERAQAKFCACIFY